MADPRACAQRASLGAIAERLAQACGRRRRGETLFRHRRPNTWRFRPRPTKMREGRKKPKVSLATLYRNGRAADLPLLQTLAPLPETEGELRRGCANAGGLRREHYREAGRHESIGSRPRRYKDYRILHFATHGLVAGDLSGLARTGSRPYAATHSTEAGGRAA